MLYLFLLPLHERPTSFCIIKHSSWLRITKDIFVEQEGLPITSVSRRLVREAIRERRCKDNCTAMVIVFRPKWLSKNSRERCEISMLLVLYKRTPKTFKFFCTSGPLYLGLWNSPELEMSSLKTDVETVGYPVLSFVCSYFSFKIL